MRLSTSVLLTVGTMLAAASPALASFAGQIILGPITNGSVVAGNNTNSNDDNDGFFSGGPVFFIWDGGDDVYELNWPGGDMLLSLTYAVPVVDNDLFLYLPGSDDESALDSISNLSPNEIFMANAPAGIYHVLVDAEAGREGAYGLAVIPAPGSAILLFAGIVTAGRRRR